MIGPELQQQLHSIIQNYGRVVLNDPAKVEGLLREAAGDSREVTLLVMALNAGAPQALAAGTSDGSDLAIKLQTENFLSPEASQSAVAAWANALGVTAAFAAPESAATPTVPEAVADPTPAVSMPPVAAAPPAATEPTPQPAPSPYVAPAPAPAPAASAPAPQAPAPQAPAAQAPAAQAPYAQAPAPQPQYVQRPYTPGPAKGSNAGVILAVVVVVVVLALGGVGFWWWKSHSAALSALTGGTTTTTGTTGAGTSGGIATSGTTGGATGAMDLATLNTKLSDWHKRFVDASTEFQQAVGAAGKLPDEAGQFDAMSVAYLKMSETTEVLASELDAMTPPDEAAPIVKKLAGNARDLSSKLGEGATAAKAHDITKFTQNGQDIQAFGEQRKAEMQGLFTTAGYDYASFESTGSLVKK